MSPFEEAVRGVPHRGAANDSTWHEGDYVCYSVYLNSRAQGPCSCDRDARIARGMEAMGSAAEHEGADMLILLRAFEEASR